MFFISMLCIVGAVGSPLFVYLRYSDYGDYTGIAGLGSIGDFVGGTTVTFLTAASVFLLIGTNIMQRKELQMSRQSVDIVIHDGEMLILNHISLERIFSINDQYQQKAGQTLDLVNRADRITNFDQFREDCLSDARVTRALTKLLNEEQRMHQVFENFANVIQVIDIFGLNIELAEENTKLVYEEKSQLLDITRLMRDSFYITYINSRDGFDEGI